MWPCWLFHFPLQPSVALELVGYKMVERLELTSWRYEALMEYIDIYVDLDDMAPPVALRTCITTTPLRGVMIS